ncbi:hypothetical protein KXW59_007562 [Aspergillus fumigatus]|nr:hypothetical protein KXW59_007562 [Aspergillus fumigatus]
MEAPIRLTVLISGNGSNLQAVIDKVSEGQIPANIHAIERAHAAWLEGKIDKTGVMIHNVISEVDMGKPILVREIPFVKGVDEDLHAFEQKVHEIEWGVVIEGVQLAINEIRARQ